MKLKPSWNDGAVGTLCSKDKVVFVFERMCKMKIVSMLLMYAASVNHSEAFIPPHNCFQRSSYNYQPPTTTTEMKMGLFDGIMKAFENDKYGPPPDALKATARHILVKTPEDASMVMGKLSDGSSTFASLAGEYSTCPSGAGGGSLGSFGPGTMVPEFDKVIFSPDTVIGSIIGPVETEFGYHLIVVDKRTGGGDWY